MSKNECWVCNGAEPEMFSRKCIEHDICDVCKTKKADIIGTPWGTKTGFICNRCQQDIWNGRIATFAKEDPDEHNFLSRDDVKCPYCGYEYYPDDLYESSDDEYCPNCNSQIEIEVEWVADYSISKPKPESTF